MQNCAALQFSLSANHIAAIMRMHFITAPFLKDLC